MPTSPSPRAASSRRNALIDGSAEPETALDHAASTSLDTVYRTEAGGLKAYFIRRLRRGELPSDYVHECFTRLATVMARKPVREPRRYLRVIARNLLFERTRQLRSRSTIEQLPLSPAFEPSVPPDQANALEANDLLKTYRRAVGELPEKTRAAFLLHRVDELTYKEIGNRLGIGIPTVQYHVARAFAHIDAALEQG